MKKVANDPGEMIVPSLREDLRLHLRPADEQDACCLIYDPVAHRYHELNESVFSVLKNWRSQIKLSEFASYLSKTLSTEILVEELSSLMMQLDYAGLFVQPFQGWRSVYQRQQRRRHGIFAWMIHNYLFIRIPLIKPDAFLDKTLWLPRFFLSKPVRFSLLIIGILGIYMASRQWDAFWNTFLHFFSLQGAVGYIFALIFVKLCHEFGHAYAAKSFGCRVPTMGIAFLVLAPVLYTDVTDAWKLKSRKERLLISGAGMIVEFGIAAIATFMWTILPEGIIKSACFFIATTSLIISVLINISPLMRFDGYYLLSDYLRIPNLQTRAFTLMCWWIREVLFSLKDPCPETWNKARQIGIIFYAFLVCIYRFFLFLGIALLVYHMTTKMLGILLFIVEIVWFILKPIEREIRVWWSLRKRIIASRRVFISGSLAGLFVLFTIIPFPHRIAVPAVIEPISIQRIVTPMHVQIKDIKVKNGDRVNPGDILVELFSESLQAEIKQVQIELDLARLRHDRRVGDTIDRDQTFILNQEIIRLNETLSGLKRLESDLTIRAKEKGIVADLMPYLHKDRWLQKDQELGILLSLEGWQVRGYIGEHLAPSVRPGAVAEFIPDNPLGSQINLRLQSIGLHAAGIIDLPYLTSTYGGEIAVNEDQKKGAIPVEAQYQAILLPKEDVVGVKSVTRGIVRIAARPESLAIRTMKRAIAILIRESGF